MRKLSFLRALNSPFRPFRLQWYFGQTAIGTPYFYPRKWVKYTVTEATIAAREELNGKNIMDVAKAQGEFNRLFDKYRSYSKPVPKKVGFDLVGLGWKTKWEDNDYRFEWAPVFSFVFFGYQIAVTVRAPEQHHYWEAWLYYDRDTDKTRSKKERIEQCRREFSLTCKVWHKGKDGATEREEIIDYYDTVLKMKYL